MPNVASILCLSQRVRTILPVVEPLKKAGGILENIIDLEDGHRLARYWIPWTWRIQINIEMRRQK